MVAQAYNVLRQAEPYRPLPLHELAEGAVVDQSRAKRFEPTRRWRRLANMYPPTTAAVRPVAPFTHGNGQSIRKKKTNAGTSQRSAALSQLSFTISEISTLFLRERPRPDARAHEACTEYRRC